jgi:hypothetical protein
LSLIAPPSTSSAPQSVDHISCSQSLTVTPLGNKDPSDTLVIPSTDEFEDPLPSAISEELPPGPRRRKNVKRYGINSEDEVSGESDSRSEAEDDKACDPGEPPIPHDESSNTDSLEIRTATSRMSFASSTPDVLMYHLVLGAYVSTVFRPTYEVQKLICYPSYFPSLRKYFFSKYSFLQRRLTQ